MNNNKINRIRSAGVIRNQQSPKAKHYLSKIRQSLTNKLCSFEQLQNPEKKQVRNQAICNSKQSIFRQSFRKLSSQNSKRSLKVPNITRQYNSESWRAIHSARSSDRLKNMKKCTQIDPIKINLEQKVLRLKIKHSQSLSRYDKNIQTIRTHPINKIKIDNQNIVSIKINSIYDKLHKETLNALQIYKEKVKLQHQNKFKTLFIKKNHPQRHSSKISQLINWAIQ